MSRYKILSARPFHIHHHRKGSLGSQGLCSLHGCGEEAVMTVEGEDRSGRRVTLGVCQRGVNEYQLADETMIQPMRA